MEVGIGKNMKWFIYVLSFFWTISKSPALDQKGRQFMISFIEPSLQNGEIIVIITAETATYVNITIPFLGSVQGRSLTAGETWKVKPSVSLRIGTTFTKVKKGVGITSNHDVTVYVMDIHKKTSSGYLALPYHALSDSYVAVTYGGPTVKSNTCYPNILLVALYDITMVEITYTFKSGGRCEGLQDGDVLSLSLGAYDAYAIICDDDFTGTQIRSNKPIVVITGHQRTLILDDAVGQDSVQEMLLPVKHFGRNYVLIGHIGHLMGSVNRIVATEDQTVVNSSTGAKYDLNAYDYVDIDTDISGQQCITSNYPILVVNFGKGYKVDFNGDEFMSFVPDTNMFSSNLHVDLNFAQVLGTTQYFSVVLVVDRDEYTGFDGTREVIPNCKYDVYTQEVTSWPLTLNTGSVKFGAFAYGCHNLKQDGIGFPLKFQLVENEESSSTVLPSSSVSPSTFTVIDESLPGSIVQDVSPSLMFTSTNFLGTMDTTVEIPSSIQTTTVNIASPTGPLMDPTVTTPSIGSAMDYATPLASAVQFTMDYTTEIASSTGPIMYSAIDVTSFIEPDNENTIGTAASTDLASLYQFHTSMVSSHIPSSIDRFTTSLSDGQQISATTLFSSATETAGLHAHHSTMTSTNSGKDPSSVLFQSSEQATFLSAENSCFTSLPDTTNGLDTNLPSDLTQTLEMMTQYSQSEATSHFGASTITYSFSSADVLTTTNTPRSSASEIFPTTTASLQSNRSSALVLIPGFKVPGSTSCGCFCNPPRPWNITEEILRKLRLKVHDLLLLEKWNLSKTVRKLTSVRDDRPSATGFGYSGVTFLVLTCVVFLLSDFTSHFTRRYNRVFRMGKRYANLQGNKKKK